MQQIYGLRYDGKLPNRPIKLNPWTYLVRWQEVRNRSEDRKWIEFLSNFEEVNNPEVVVIK